jgi:hypothetical protein
MKFFVGLFLTLSLLFATPAFAINQTLIGSSGKTIEITGLDADWVWSTDLAGEHWKVTRAAIKSIKFYPSGANDRMIIRDGGIDNATFFDSGLVSGADDPRVEYYDGGTQTELVIDITDCALGTPGSAKVVIHLY